MTSKTGRLTEKFTNDVPALIATFAWAISLYPTIHISAFADRLAHYTPHIHFPVYALPALIFGPATFVFSAYVRNRQITSNGGRLLTIMAIIIAFCMAVAFTSIRHTGNFQEDFLEYSITLLWAYGLKAIWDQLRDSFAQTWFNSR